MSIMLHHFCCLGNYEHVDRAYVSFEFDFGQKISVLVKLVFLFRHENVIMKHDND